VNFLDVDDESGAAMGAYDSLQAWRTHEGRRLYNVWQTAATSLFNKGSHGYSGLAPPYPTEDLALGIEWVNAEKQACLQEGGPEGGHCDPDFPVEDGGTVVTLDPRTAAEIAFNRDVAPLIQSRSCSACHAGTGAYAALPINFIASFPSAPATPRLYDSILAYRILESSVDGQPYLLDFAKPERSLLLAKGAHQGSSLATQDAERLKVMDWVRLEKEAACYEGTYACQRDAGPSLDAAVADANQPVDAAPQDGSLIDAGPYGHLTARERSRAYYYDHVSTALKGESCHYCHMGSLAKPYDYMDHMGGAYEYESVVSYISSEYANLYNFSDPSMSLMLTKGEHTGPAFGRYGLEDEENFKTWVLLEYEAQLAPVEDAGALPVPDAGFVPVDAGQDAGALDAAILDAGPPSPRQLAQSFFEEAIYPHIVSRGCRICHMGPLAASYATRPINWLDQSGTPYESVLQWRSLLGTPLLDFSYPEYSLLGSMPAHANGGKAYAETADTLAKADFVTWVLLEEAAACHDGTLTCGVADAGTMDASVPDAAAQADAATALDAGFLAPDAAVERAVAKDFFYTNIYINLLEPCASGAVDCVGGGRPDAECMSCHVEGRGPTAFMVSPGFTADLADRRYEYIRTSSKLVSRQVPSASLLLLKDETHEGNQGLVRPASRDVDTANFLQWVALENAADTAALGGAAGGTTSTCETQFFPRVPPEGSELGAESQVDLAEKLCRPDLQGAVATLEAKRLGTGFEFSYLSLISPPETALHVTSVYLTRWSLTIDADGGYQYFPEEVVDVKPGFDETIPAATFYPITTTPGILMAHFYGDGGFPDAGGLVRLLSVEFGSIGAAGSGLDAGQGQAEPDGGLTACTNLDGVDGFTATVLPRLTAAAVDGGAISCSTCHDMTVGGPYRAYSKMNLSELMTNAAVACAEVKRWINSVNPSESTMFVNVDPARTGNAHGWWFPSTTDDFQYFKTALTPWIESEAP
jgi:hypothetical protein